MKTPRQFLFERHRSAQPKLDYLRRPALAGLAHSPSPDMNEPSPAPIFERSELVRCFRWLFSWRGLRRVLIVLAWSATIIALLYGEENWRGRRLWNRSRQQLEARGEQLEFKDFIPQ